MVNKDFYQDIYQNILGIRKILKEEGIELKSYQEETLNLIEQDYNLNQTPGAAYYTLEDWLYTEGKDKDIKIKSAMIWGSLWILYQMGVIDWNKVRTMYGEFMSKNMKVR